MPQEDATSNQPEKKGFFKRLFDNYKPKNYIEAALLVGGIIALAAIPGAAFLIPQVIGGYIGYKNAKAEPKRSVAGRTFLGVVLGGLGITGALVAAGLASVNDAYNMYREKKKAAQELTAPQTERPQQPTTSKQVQRGRRLSVTTPHTPNAKDTSGREHQGL